MLYPPPPQPVALSPPPPTREVVAIRLAVRDTAEIQPRCSRDVAEMQPRCSRDAADSRGCGPAEPGRRCLGAAVNGVSAL